MPIHTYKCPKCGREEDKLSGCAKEDLHCSCGMLMEKQFRAFPWFVANRQKPGSFKFDPAKVDADMDMIHHYKSLEEKGEMGKEAKEDADYHYQKLKHKL